MSREWRLYVADMKGCCERVTQYTSGLSREEFENRRMAYDATLRNLGLLGEAARHVPDDVIWDIVRNEIAPLRKALAKLEASAGKL